jgi:hypothetical protein
MFPHRKYLTCDVTRFVYCRGQSHLDDQFQTTHCRECRASCSVLRRNVGEYAVDEQYTTNRPLLVFLMICSTTCTQIALLASFRIALFDAVWPIQRCFLDCRSISCGLGTLLGIDQNHRFPAMLPFALGRRSRENAETARNRLSRQPPANSTDTVSAATINSIALAHSSLNFRQFDVSRNGLGPSSIR